MICATSVTGQGTGQEIVLMIALIAAIVVVPGVDHATTVAVAGVAEDAVVLAARIAEGEVDHGVAPGTADADVTLLLDPGLGAGLQGVLTEHARAAGLVASLPEVSKMDRVIKHLLPWRDIVQPRE